MSHRTALRARKGSALILVLMMTLAIAGLSIAAIFMSSSAGLLSAFYDKERTHRLAAESALEVVRSRLSRDTAFVLPDTGVRQLLAGASVRDADGTEIPSVRVNVYAAVTGDTTGRQLPMVTLIAASYDASGTRYVHRMDLRRESFARYAMFVDSFPSTVTHGPETVAGRVHSNGNWRMSGSGNRFRDTLTAVGTVSGSGTFDVDSVVGVPRIPYPRDSTFPRLDSLAAAANLAFTPVSGGTRGSRLEFVAYDVDGDGEKEASEGFVRVFDLANGGWGDTTLLRASPVPVVFGPSYRWDDPIVQNQCGAFYLRSGRWHFFPISAHRRPYVATLLVTTAPTDYPTISTGVMGQVDDYDIGAVNRIMNLPTARCFPAGSPYLMASERMTNSAGVVTGTAADTVPFGVVVPAGGWPVGFPSGYGGSDTTFTVRSRSCRVSSSGSGRCVGGTLADLGSWRAFPGTPLGSAANVQAVERSYLWPLHAPYNTASRGVVSVRSGPIYLSGEVAGPVTLRVNGRVTLVDRVLHVREPNDPSVSPCTHQLGLLAVGDILVVEGLTSRVRRIANFLGTSAFVSRGGAEPRFSVHGSLMSLAGTVGVETPAGTNGTSSAQLPCPDDGASSTNSNGGCFALTGGMAMREYSAIYTSTPYSGFRHHTTPDRCATTTSRPPFFPLTNRYTFVRSLEVDANQANTPTKIRSLLLRLKGRAL